jgi:glutamyl-tRNA synthetase
MSQVITRFAPSPTGYLHIGGARTALFNWLYAKHHGGKFYLRVEDTDRARSTEAATQAILDGMSWLGLEHDGEVVYQFSNMQRHAEVAKELLKAEKAYECYTTAEELDAWRTAHPNQKFRSPWRDGGIPPSGITPSIRIKAPLEGSITVADKVQGTVSVDVSELDDMVILRSDGTPTYMLAVVVDDHDMGITQVIRGDDHFTNTFRQLIIYDAMGWKAPDFAHIPLIHGMDGAKLSKRHGALGVDAYRDMGYLPEAVCNYLLRLGWSHGDDEIISQAQAIEWFNLEACGKSPSRFDFAKLESVNAHYIREADDARLVDLITPLLPATNPLLLKAMPALKQRAKTIKELAENAAFYVARPKLDETVKAQLAAGQSILDGLLPKLEALTDWNHDSLQAVCKAHGEEIGQKLGAIMSPIRIKITGKTASPSMFEVMDLLGKTETLARLRTIC